MEEASKIKINNLVLFKKRPAVVVRIKDRLQIQLADGNIAKVRLKDVKFLHQGPVEFIENLTPDEADVITGWEILLESVSDDRVLDLDTLAEFVFGSSSPANNWGAWLLLEDGLYFKGEPDNILVCTPEQVEAELESRRLKLQTRQQWQEFVSRAEVGEIDLQKDSAFLQDVEDFALGRSKESRLLKALGRNERPEVAHALLLEWGCWDVSVNPYPIRFDLPTTSPALDCGSLPAVNREDLTYLKSFAIDDRDNRDPDDAISLESAEFENGRLQNAVIWIHIADVGALIPPDSPMDVEARSRGASLYLPEKAVNMLPEKSILNLGLGLENPTSALSFRIELQKNAEIKKVEVISTKVNVERINYDDAEILLESAPLKTLWKVLGEFTERRRNRGALFIDFPETIIRIENGDVEIRPLPRLRSRNLVREAMLLTGEAAAKLATEEGIPFPFVQQQPPVEPEHPELKQLVAMPGLAGQYALRRTLRRSHVSVEPGLHSGVGVSGYTRVTSPLRRYVDLVAHQQLQAYVGKGKMMDQMTILERLGASESVTTSINQVESYSKRHWTIVYLMQRPGWQGKGILVDRNGMIGRMILPELALETSIHLPVELPLNCEVNLVLKSTNLPELDAGFYIHPIP